MNIFAVNENPKIAARELCDKHVVKMILESAQLLSTCQREMAGDKCSDVFYKSTHKNHPSSIWTRANARHYHWLYNLFYYLCEEYEKRYNKTHLTDATLKMRLKYTPDKMKLDFFSAPPQCMPDKYKQMGGTLATVRAYQQFYIGEKSRFAKWEKGTPMPDFMKGTSE